MDNEQKPISNEEKFAHIYSLSDKLKALKDEKASLEDKKKKVEEEIEETDEAMVALMIDTETPSFTRSGFTFSLTNTKRASAVADCKSKLYEALKKEGHGDLVYETVNANSLSAFVKEQIENNDDELPDWLEGLVNVYDQKRIGVRKSTKKNS